MKIAYITHPLCLKHDMGDYHPESPARLRAIERQLRADGLFDSLVKYEAPEATREQLLRAHDAEHVDRIAALSPPSCRSEGGLVELDPDTAMNPYSYRAALHAAGAAVLGVDLAMRGEVDHAFCAVRPPGHHAGRSRAMGFCIFNNVAVAALHALEQYGLQRVAIADFDVHHGNGTEDIVHDDSRVMLCSTFQHPYYPYMGADSGNDHIVNVPLPAGTGSAGFRDAVTTHWLSALQGFKPELLLVSAGFDAHRDDGLAGMNLVEDDYAWVTRELAGLAETHCAGRIVSVLEGGYELGALGRSVAAHVRALIGRQQLVSAGN